MIKVVLFDADGVLINNVDLFSAHLARDYGITLEMTADFFNGIMKDCITGKADLRTILPSYFKKWGWTKSIDEFLNYWHTSEHNLDKLLLDYIGSLRKQHILCCLATNQTKERFAYMLKEMGLADVFDKVYCSAHLGHKKPETEFYKKVLKDLGAVKNEVLFWDDKPSNIEGAKAVGINAELYTNFSDFKTKMKKYGFVH